MSEFKLPFRPQFQRPMMDGTKLMTCRTKKWGEPGDVFEAWGHRFILTHVMRMRLGYVGSDCFEQEGVESVQEFMEVWKSIHPTNDFDGDQIVWAHCFRRVSP